MVREICFQEHRKTIAQIRREVYTSGLIHDIDEFDEDAHHFALFNTTQEIIGVIRVLRDDQVPKLELQSESDAQDLVYPRSGLIMEVSRGCARKSILGMPLVKMAMAMQDYAKKQNAAHIVTKSGTLLLPLYKTLGFRVFGRPFYSDWFDDRKTGLMSIPIIYDFVKQAKPVQAIREAEEEEMLVW